MAQEQFTYDDLLRIVELIKSSAQFSEFRLKVGEVEIELRRRSADGAPAQILPPTPKGAPTHAPSLTTASEVPATTDRAPTWPEGAHVIRSPMVGTFYRSPEPGAKPFVEIGQRVEPATIVCIVEVMKLMNSVSSDVHGTVLQVLVGDSAPVQAGQALIVVQPETNSK